MIAWFEKHNKLSWVITIIIAIVIFYVSSLTFPPSEAKGFDWRPIAYHFYAFLFLGAFLLIAITKGEYKNKRFLFVVIIIALAYAVSDEIHQMFVPGRAGTFLDFLVDSAGILFAALIYSLKFFGSKKIVREEYNADLYY